MRFAATTGTAGVQVDPARVHVTLFDALATLIYGALIIVEQWHRF